MPKQYLKNEHALHNSLCTATWVIPTWNAQKGGLQAHTSYKWLAFIIGGGGKYSNDKTIRPMQGEGAMPFIRNYGAREESRNTCHATSNPESLIS